ncbi:hypothetical protein [Nocardia sp. KC 131]|uniref:hypothetical protein n=1 Tax=Nocardia arseniciresistens TaxID=3392119 RepID=UPI00398F3699
MREKDIELLDHSNAHSTTTGTVFTNGYVASTSLALTAETPTDTGIPTRSDIMWIFEPGLPRTTQKCATKTIRRHAARTLDTLAYLLLSPPVGPASLPAQSAMPAGNNLERGDLDDAVRGFWQLRPGARVDIVCSEIPNDERPECASPADRDYLRYAKFADLDTLIFMRTRLAQLAPSVVVRDFAPSEYYDIHADVLVVIGGPRLNAKYREFLPQLPFRFDPHPLGEDDPLVAPDLDDLTLSPRCGS